MRAVTPTEFAALGDDAVSVLGGIIQWQQEGLPVQH